MSRRETRRSDAVRAQILVFVTSRTAASMSMRSANGGASSMRDAVASTASNTLVKPASLAASTRSATDSVHDVSDAPKPPSPMPTDRSTPSSSPTNFRRRKSEPEIPEWKIAQIQRAKVWAEEHNARYMAGFSSSAHAGANRRLCDEERESMVAQREERRQREEYEQSTASWSIIQSRSATRSPSARFKEMSVKHPTYIRADPPGVSAQWIGDGMTDDSLGEPRTVMAPRKTRARANSLPVEGAGKEKVADPTALADRLAEDGSLIDHCLTRPTLVDRAKRFSKEVLRKARASWEGLTA